LEPEEEEAAHDDDDDETAPAMSPVLPPAAKETESLGPGGANEEATDDEEEDVDCMVVTGEMDALALVEEELLLALPMMALHDTESCHASFEAQEEEDEAPALKPSPFAMLSRLKNS